MSEKQTYIGNNCETQALDWLKENGYWCHLFRRSRNGQPCDIIALSGEKAFLIDAKHCVGDRFATSRIEPNQRTSMLYAKLLGVKNAGFMIWFESDKTWRWLPFSEELLKVKSIEKDKIEKMGDFV